MSKSILVILLITLAVAACDMESCKAKKAVYVPADTTSEDGTAAVVVPPPEDKGSCEPMSNDAIINEIKKCTENGMDASHFHCGSDDRTTHIECRQHS